MARWGRLTQEVMYPLKGFKQCQFCGRESDEITDFRMWTECNSKDKPERGNIVILCKSKPCQKVLDNHPRLYMEVPWGEGDPGHFMLLCGDCVHRDGFGCTHEDLKSNGGDGLMITFGSARGFVCKRGRGGRCSPMPRPATKCAGKRHLQMVGDG